MTKTVQVHVGETLDVIGKRVINAWHRAERGELTPDKAEIHIGFELGNDDPHAVAQAT